MKRMWTLIACLVAALLLCYYVATRSTNAEQRLKDLQLSIGYGLLVIVFFLGFVVLVYLITGEINLSELLNEHGGGASMSRFQLLIFTFVIALSLIFIIVGSGKFPEPIPSGVLTLLGISATTYGVSKGIQAGGGLKSKIGPDGGGDGTSDSGDASDGQSGTGNDTQTNKQVH